ncbi:retrotransposon protein, putative, ty1-copia subclass [Tanacetum coccineum]
MKDLNISFGAKERIQEKMEWVMYFEGICPSDCVFAEVEPPFKEESITDEEMMLYFAQEHDNSFHPKEFDDDDAEFVDSIFSMYGTTSLDEEEEEPAASVVDNFSTFQREALTLEDVMAILNSKEIKERSKAKEDDGEGLYVRGITDRRDSLAGELNVSVEEKDSLAQVWHKRLRHISEAGLHVLEKQVGIFGEAHYLRGAIDSVTFQTEGMGLYSQFEQLCVESGIAKHLTDFGMPQQNRLADRMNRTLIDKGVKGYRLYRLDNESPKIVTNRNEVFNENVMYKDTLKDSGVDQEDGDDEDTGDQETDQTSDLTGYQLVRDREPKIRTKPLRFQDETAMEEEMDSLRKNKTWELANYPARQKLVSCTWLFKIKEGIEVRHTSIQVILALTACKDYELEQLDVKTAFLHGNLKEMIYMRKPPDSTCYSLSKRFKRSSYNSYVYYRSYAPGEYIHLLLYVDDMLIACKSKAKIRSTKFLLKRELDMKELGEANKILGMKIIKDQSRRFRESQSRSIIGYAFLVQGCVVSWNDTLQHVVALSTTEAEYMALTKAVKEAMWLRGLLEELGVSQNSVAVNCDNQRDSLVARNHVFQERTKHIMWRNHFNRRVLGSKDEKNLKV